MRIRNMSLCAISLLLACELEDPKETDTGDQGVTDDDGDGFAVEDDCDDNNAGINPDAAESCDGVDNNCDGAIDEGVTVTVYTDSDGDGYGDDDSGAEACAAADGQSEQAGDCDDADDTISPAASEICDKLDNDCDGLTDDEDDTLDLKTALTWYADADADAYGDAGVEVLACDIPAGFVADSTDCDDTAAQTYPGAAEVCGDGAVNDCDSTAEAAVDACEGTVDHDEDFVVKSSTNIGFGYDASLGGDYNGDGFDDLLVGAYNTGKLSDGEAYIFYGSASGVGTFSEADADVTLTGEAGSYFGLYNEYLGDLDSDGYDDVLIGAYNLYDAKADVYGGLYVVYGGTTSGSILSDYRLHIHGDSTNPISQYSNHGAADFDGDGHSDIFVSSNATSQYVFSGLTTGTVSVNDADATISSTKHTPYFYEAAAGDLDGDGTPELVACDLNGSGASMPSAYVFSGGDLSGDLDLSDADASIRTETSGTSYLCFSLAILDDTNGDGYADVTAGDIFASSWLKTQAEAYVFQGPISGDITVADADATLATSYSNAYLGYGIGGGDYDADGLSDLVVADPLYTDKKGTTVGAAFLVYGDRLSGQLSTDDAVMLEGDASSFNYATGIGSAGDFNADGFSDIVISSFVGTTSGEGDTHIIFGASRY